MPSSAKHNTQVTKWSLFPTIWLWTIPSGASLRTFRPSMVPRTSWSAGCLVEMTYQYSSSLSFIGRAMHARESFFNILITICLQTDDTLQGDSWTCQKSTNVPSLIHLNNSRLKTNLDNLLDKFDKAFPFLPSSSGHIPHHQQKGIVNINRCNHIQQVLECILWEPCQCNHGLWSSPDPNTWHQWLIDMCTISQTEILG